LSFLLLLHLSLSLCRIVPCSSVLPHWCHLLLCVILQVINFQLIFCHLWVDCCFHCSFCQYLRMNCTFCHAYCHVHHFCFTHSVFWRTSVCTPVISISCVSGTHQEYLCTYVSRQTIQKELKQLHVPEAVIEEQWQSIYAKSS